jgi:glycosyltransferase involved in cell wall biosynthesis
MRIVHVTNIVSPDKQGGLERYVRELAETQAAEGHRVSIIAKAGPGVREPRLVLSTGVDINRYFGPSKQNPLFVVMYPFTVTAGVLRVLRRLGVRRSASADRTVFHAHHPVPAIALRLARLPYVYTFHAPVFKEIIGERQASYKSSDFVLKTAVFAMRLLESWLLRGAARVHTLSDFVRAEALALGVRPGRCSVIPGGIQLDRFSVSTTTPTADGTRLFAARRLVERTGVEELVEAFAEIRRAVPAAELFLSGTGPRKAAIEQRVEALGLSGSVHLLGWISDDELVEQYRRATLTVVPTQYLEGFGLSTAESLACGTPAVVTPVGANPELLRDLDPSLIAADASSSAIAAAVVAVLQDKPALTRARRTLSPGYARRWGWSEVSRRVLEMYTFVQKPGNRER